MPYSLTRVGVVMTPEHGNLLEVEGVLNPGSGRGPDGEVYLLPRLVALGNVSRIGLARSSWRTALPVGVERQGVLLEPDRSWERGVGNAGVEDPRITWIDDLGLHVMTYVAYGRSAPGRRSRCRRICASGDASGPVLFTYDDDARHRPEPVPQQGRRLLPRAR